jgi:aminoglycoside 6'-N-acetyltransferase
MSGQHEAVVTLRPLQPDDLELVEQWLAAPHVAPWYVAGSSVARELEAIRRSINGAREVHVLGAEVGERVVGWCQWYLCADDPDWASDIGADASAVGIDYAIGVAEEIGHGTGTELVRTLVDLVRQHHPSCAVFADPDERNVASRRVLEKNGFTLVAVKRIPSEPTDDPMAVYRLAPPG